jgi:transcriptional regulator with XRE-family HTH domain
MEQSLQYYVTDQNQKLFQESNPSGNAAAENLEPFLDKEYRDAYLDGYVKGSIALQVRALRNKLKLNQVDFAKKMGMTQSVVSRLEDADYGNVTVNTLLRVARENNVGINIQFVDYVSVVNADLSPASLKVDDVFESYISVQQVNISLNGASSSYSFNDTAIFIMTGTTPSTVSTGVVPWQNNHYPNPQSESSTPLKLPAFETLNIERYTQT